jgi:glycosyltransferase involved in cell wall biosynthesis
MPHVVTQPVRATATERDRRLRICFVGLQNLPVLWPRYRNHGIGGEQVQQTLLARAFSRRGFDVCMVVADYGQPDAEVIEDIALFKAYELDGGLPGLRFVHPRLTGLWGALARANADAHYVSIAGPHLGIVAAFTQLRRRRLVFRIASDADCDPHRLLIHQARNRWLYSFGLRRADVVLAQTTQQMRALQANYGVTSRLASMLVERAGPRRDFAERDVDVLWVGNLLPLKRPQLALALARRLPHLQVHMVGGPQPGHERLYEAMRAEAATLPNVHFHGRLPHQETGALFDRARVLVNTSETEGFPNVYLQAWRRESPVVTFIDPDGVVERFGLGACVACLDTLTAEAGRLALSEADWTAAGARCGRYMDEHHAEGAVLAPYLQSLTLGRPAQKRLGAMTPEKAS